LVICGNPEDLRAFIKLMTAEKPKTSA